MVRIEFFQHSDKGSSPLQKDYATRIWRNGIALALGVKGCKLNLVILRIKFNIIFIDVFAYIAISFLSFISTNLLGRYIGVYGSRILSTLSIFISFMLSLLAFYESALSGSVCSFILLSWINIELFITPWAFCLIRLALQCC